MNPFTYAHSFNMTGFHICTAVYIPETSDILLARMVSVVFRIRIWW